MLRPLLATIRAHRLLYVQPCKHNLVRSERANGSIFRPQKLPAEVSVQCTRGLKQNWQCALHGNVKDSELADRSPAVQVARRNQSRLLKEKQFGASNGAIDHLRDTAETPLQKVEDNHSQTHPVETLQKHRCRKLRTSSRIEGLVWFDESGVRKEVGLAADVGPCGRDLLSQANVLYSWKAASVSRRGVFGLNGARCVWVQPKECPSQGFLNTPNLRDFGQNPLRRK